METLNELRILLAAWLHERISLRRLLAAWWDLYIAHNTTPDDPIPYRLIEP